MDLRGLRYFYEVATQGGFTRAAEVLHVTQPTISKMIRQLEENLGMRLLVRTHHSVQLTEAGKLLFRHSKEILRQVATLKSEVDGLRGVVTGELRLAIPPPLAGGRFLTHELGKFNRLHPAVGLKVREVGGLAVWDGILSGEWDIGISRPTINDPRFGYLRLFHEQIDLVVPADHRLAGQQIGMAEIGEERLVLFPEAFVVADRFLDACRSAGLTPHIACTSGQWEFLLGLVEAGVGLSPMPRYLQRHLDPRRLAQARLQPDIHYELGLAWRADLPLCRAAECFLALVREELVAGDTPLLSPLNRLMPP